MTAPITMNQLLQQLKTLRIDAPCHTHQPVLTVEAMVAELGKLGISGTQVKNLFLKDKKNRLYIITAHADTRLDLKRLSARLGLGKGGIRMAPDELLQPVLALAPGSVTPLAVVQPTASAVVLLIDSKLRGADALLVHPLQNDATLQMSSAQLETFLKSLGREPLYADFEHDPFAANPNDPQACQDLAPLIANAQTSEVAKEMPKAADGQGKSASKGKKGAAGSAQQPQRKPLDTAQMAEDLVEQVLKGTGQDLHSLPADKVRMLVADIGATLNSLRNLAYAAGFADAKAAAAAAIRGDWQ